VRRAIPSVVFIAHDDRGREVSKIDVSIDDAPSSESAHGALISLDPGEHTYRVSADGYATVRKRWKLEEGQKGLVQPVVLVPMPSPLAMASESSHGRPRSVQRTISYVTAGAGILGLGVGGGLGILALNAHGSAEDACPAHACRDRAPYNDERRAQGLASSATVSIVAGAALLIGALTLLFTTPNETRP
jgi:hypothetical protein